MKLTAVNRDNQPVTINIADITLSGICELVNVNIDTDSEPTDILTPVKYKSGTLSILIEDNNAYKIDWYGKNVLINWGAGSLNGKISAPLTNASFDCQREVIELQFVDNITWLKSMPYSGLLHGTVRDIIKHFKDLIGAKTAVIDKVYNVQIGTAHSPLDMIVNVSSLSNDITTLTNAEVFEAICRLLCVTAEVVGDTLYLTYVCSRALEVDYETIFADNSYAEMSRTLSVQSLRVAQSGTTVSTVDPKKSVTITCNFDEYQLPESKIEYQPIEYDKFSYSYNYDGDIKEEKHVSLLQAFGKQNNTIYYVYQVLDSADYRWYAGTPEISFWCVDSDKTYNISKMKPVYSGSNCAYHAGAIHTKCCSQQLDSLEAEPTGDEQYNEGLLLYGLRGMTIMMTDDLALPNRLYPMYYRTIDINTVFSSNKALIYSVSMQWLKYREEFFKCDYAGSSAKDLRFNYPRLAFRIKTANDSYLPVQNTGSKISDFDIVDAITLDNTWSIIQPKNPTFPESYNDYMRLSFDDFWSVTESIGNSIILPKNTYIKSIEIVLLWARQVKLAELNTPLGTDAKLPANLFIEESWKLESRGVNINDTDTVYIWENDYPNISGDEINIDADFPSHDDKGESTNALTIQNGSNIELVSNQCNSAVGDNLHPEEVRLRLYEKQYSTPTLTQDITAYGNPATDVVYLERVSGKYMRVISNSYNPIENQSKIKLIEIK